MRRHPFLTIRVNLVKLGVYAAASHEASLKRSVGQSVVKSRTFAPLLNITLTGGRCSSAVAYLMLCCPIYDTYMVR